MVHGLGVQGLRVLVSGPGSGARRCTAMRGCSRCCSSRSCFRCASMKCRVCRGTAWCPTRWSLCGEVRVCMTHVSIAAAAAGVLVRDAGCARAQRGVPSGGVFAAMRYMRLLLLLLLQVCQYEMQGVPGHSVVSHKVEFRWRNRGSFQQKQLAEATAKPGRKRSRCCRCIWVFEGLSLLGLGFMRVWLLLVSGVGVLVCWGSVVVCLCLGRHQTQAQQLRGCPTDLRGASSAVR
jgi:hypothetical protein